VLAIPPADRFDVSTKVIKELSSSNADVTTELAGIVSLTQKHQVVKLQERFKALVTEQVYVLIDQRIEKLKRRDHILPYRVSEVITAQVELRVDRGEMTLHLAQLIINAPEAQTQWFYDHVQQ
jgi:hypothetical protein